MSKRLRRFMVVADNHGDKANGKAVAAALDFKKSFRPEVRIHLGDGFNFECLRKNASEQERRAIDFSCSLIHNNDYIDIYTYTDEGEKYSYCGGLKRYFDEEKRVLDNWTEIEFKGMRFRTVEDPAASLARWYGEDWRTPKKPEDQAGQCAQQNTMNSAATIEPPT